MSETKQYIYKIQPVRNNLIETMTPEEQVIMAEHFSYLQSFLEEGKLILAGPCLDAAFGIVIFEAESDEEAQRIMKNDPAVKHHIMTAEFHEFKVSLMRK